MPYTEWKPGTPIASPVYLDASFLIAGIVSSDVRYRQAILLFADLLASRAEIVLSSLAVSETLWGIVKLSYCELHNQKARAHFTKDAYLRNHQAIFTTFRNRFNAVGTLVRDWRQAGVAFKLVPQTFPGLENVTTASAAYMQSLKFASADAMHLAMAEAEARSFVTTDSEFDVAVSSPLSILHIGK